MKPIKMGVMDGGLVWGVPIYEKVTTLGDTLRVVHSVAEDGMGLGVAWNSDLAIETLPDLHHRVSEIHRLLELIRDTDTMASAEEVLDIFHSLWGPFMGNFKKLWEAQGGLF